MEWIKSENKLPNDDKEYLFVNQWGAMFLGQYYEYKWIVDGAPDNFVTNVTHWCELPKLPTE